MEFNKENVLFEIRNFRNLFSNDWSRSRASFNAIELERRIYAMEEKVIEAKPEDIPDLIVWIPDETLAFYNVSDFRVQGDLISFYYKSNTNNATKRAYLKPIGWSLTVKENVADETKR